MAWESPTELRAQTAQDIRGEDPPANGVWVETLGMDAMFQRRGRPVAGGIPRRRGPLPITLGGIVYPHGIGTQSISEFVLNVNLDNSPFG